MGQGSNGKVCLAVRRGERQGRVAIKVSRPVDVEELRKEYERLRSVSHPRIIAAIDFLEGRSLSCMPATLRMYKAGLVMEVAATDLGEWLAIHGPCFDAGLASIWSFHLASALAHIHRLGVVHRDIKPGNCLLCYEDAGRPGGYMRVVLKVSDFGSARALPAEAPRKIIKKQACIFDGAYRSMERQFEMTALVATSWWRAPELLGNTVTADQLDEAADGAVTQYGVNIDVWSCGATIYEMLTGEHLASATSGVGLLRCLLQRVVEPCPYPCSDAGSQSSVPPYMTEPCWELLFDVAQQRGPIQRAPRPEGGQWDVVVACLRWHPSARVSMHELLRMPWLRQASVDDESTRAAVTGGSQTLVARDAAASSTGARADADAVDCADAPPTPTPGERRQRHLSAPVLRLSQDYSRKTTTVRGKTCRCKGQCRIFQHRKDGKCLEKWLVEGTDYCIKCLCMVQGCDMVMLKSPWCYHHSRVFGLAPLPVQLAVLAADVAPLLVPCDITDFLSMYAEIQTDLALCIICALVKEPTATRKIVEQWRPLPAEYTAAELQHALERVLRACASTPGGEDTPHSREQEQLTRQGVARFSGLASVAKDLGVLQGVGEGADYSITLGRTHVKYKFTRDAGTLHKFLSCVRAAAAIHPPCFDAGAQSSHVDAGGSPAAFGAVQQYGEGLRSLMQQLGHEINMGTKTGAGYKVDIVVRKLCMPHLEGLPWHLVPRDRIREISADEKENLSCLPQTWTAAQISSFVCGRPDWPCLASMFMCIWKVRRRAS